MFRQNPQHKRDFKHTKIKGKTSIFDLWFSFLLVKTDTPTEMLED